MSRRNRILTVLLALATVLTLAAPPPTHAAGLRASRLPAIPSWSRAWSWLAGLLPAGLAPKPPERQEKEGGAINPDGRGTPPPPSTAQSGLQGPDGGW